MWAGCVLTCIYLCDISALIQLYTLRANNFPLPLLHWMTVLPASSKGHCIQAHTSRDVFGQGRVPSCFCTAHQKPIWNKWPTNFQKSTLFREFRKEEKRGEESRAEPSRAEPVILVYAFEKVEYGKMAPQVKALLALAEDLGSNPRTHMVAQPCVTPVPEDPIPSSDLLRH